MKPKYARTLVLLCFATLLLFTSCRHRVQKMIARGNIEFEKKNFTQAMEYYQKALSINPNSWEAYYDIALCKTNLNNDSGAINDYTSAAFINPKENVNIYINRGHLNYKLLKYKDALADYQTALEMNPSNHTLIISICECYRNLGNSEEALKEANKLIEADPKFALAYSERGYLKIKMNKFQEAIEDLNKGLDIDSTDPLMYNNRAHAELELKEIEKALIDVEKSIQLNPKNSFAYKIRAKIFIERNEKDKACYDLKKALELGYTKTYGNDVQELLDKNCK